MLVYSDKETKNLLDLGLLDTLYKLTDHKNIKIRAEIYWTLSNITAGTSDQIQQCIDKGFL